MEIGTLVLALINLVLVVLEGRHANKPERDARAARKDATNDVEQLNTALHERDADGVAAFFERERLEAWGRLDAAGDDRNGDGLRTSRRDDSGQPPAGGSA